VGKIIEGRVEDCGEGIKKGREREGREIDICCEPILYKDTWRRRERGKERKRMKMSAYESRES
jgi:hypothetical protein